MRAGKGEAQGTARGLAVRSGAGEHQNKQPGWQRNSARGVQSSSSSIPLQHPNSAAPPPAADAHRPPRSAASTECRLPASRTGCGPAQRPPAQHHVTAETHTPRRTPGNVALVAFSPPFPVRAGGIRRSQPPLCEWKRSSNREKPMERHQRRPQPALRCDGSSEKTPSPPQQPVSIGLFSAGALRTGCSAIFHLGSQTKAQHPTSTSFLCLQFSEI